MSINASEAAAILGQRKKILEEEVKTTRSGLAGLRRRSSWSSDDLARYRELVNRHDQAARALHTVTALYNSIAAAPNGRTIPLG